MKSIKKLLVLVAVLLALCVFAAAADHTAANLEELYQILFENLKEQDDAFTVTYTGARSDLPLNGEFVSVPILARDMTATLPNPDGNGPDVHMLNILEVRCGNADNGDLEFFVKYLLDTQQLAWVQTQVADIAQSLQLEGLNDYLKIKKIYQYMGTNFTYDHTLKQFTDYEGLTTGTMVCQGYALLTYKLMWHCGVPCRIIVGQSSNENHGWNIVKLDGKWYNLDTTWDAASEKGAPMYWNFFLRSPKDFSDHINDIAFQMPVFTDNHPMADESYAVPSIEILIDGVLYSGLTIRNGKNTQLQAVLHPEKDVKVTWATSDEAVVSVDETGNITSLTPGSVYITATAEDPEYLPGVFPVTAVDLTSCSDWADAELNSYYLRKLYPANFCENFQTAITREEFAQLLYVLMSSYTPAGGQYQAPPFEDIGESPYWFGVIYTSCRGIFQGTGEKTFSPQLLLTREQAAKVLCTLLDFMKISYDSTSPKTFADRADISPWAAEYVDKASSAGLLLGTDTGYFNPHATLTREEAAVMLERLFVNFIEPTLPKADAA